MLKRSFEVFSIDLETLNLLGAIQSKEGCFHCELTYEQSRILPRRNKLNTQLFEQLTQIIDIPYKVSHNIFSDFLYDCIFLDMNVRGTSSTLCQLEMDAKGNISAVKPIAQDTLIKDLYTYGFTISGVPAQDSADTKDIHYRAFIASASMARKGIYLFVNENHYQKLMERLSLGFFSFSMKEKRITASEDLKSDFRISPSKMSAYLGLMLSDGVSMKEARTAWKESSDLCGITAPELDLSEETVFVAHDLERPAREFFAQNGSHVWMFENVPSDMNELSVCELQEEETASLIATFRSFDSKTEWTPSVLETWKKIVLSYIADGTHLEWRSTLPAIPKDDAQFQKNLHHYAYLLAAFLYRKLHGFMKNTSADQKIWSEDDVFETRIAKSISKLSENQDIKNTLSKIKKSNDAISIIKIDKNDDDDASSESAPAKDTCVKTNGGLLLVFEDNINTKMYEAKLVPAEGLDHKLNLFDGVGLCDPNTFDILEKLLLRTNTLSEERRYSALIIRLPWLKGVIVRCDFHAFFKEKCPVLPKTIKDAFNQDRKLKKIQIIVNQSMLKGFKYLRNLTNAGDPWAYYWKMIKKYNYELLITGRNSLPGKTARLNSQFLSTISLSDKQMDTLVARNIQKLRNALQDEEAKRRFFAGVSNKNKEADKSDDDELDDDELNDDKPYDDKPYDNELDTNELNDDEPYDDDGMPEPDHDIPKSSASQSLNTNNIFGAVLKTAIKIEGESSADFQKKLLSTRYANSALQSHIRSRIIDCLQGRLEVAADYRFVAPDLLCMLHYLADRYLIDPHCTPGTVPGEEHYKTKYKLVSVINFPGKANYRGHGFFYAPGKNAPWKNSEDGDICALRNPHYALGEGAILTALPGDQSSEYDRWFGHLDSCIQLPATAASTMGGADFDGDRCLCVAERRIVKALKNSIEHNIRTLKHIVENKQVYLHFLEDQIVSAEKHAPIVQYLENIKFWMNSCLPTSYKSKRYAYCPPLFFALDNHGIDFTPEEKNIEGYLFDAFIMTTQQRIGLLSIEALNLTGSAYATQLPCKENLPVYDPLPGLSDAFSYNHLMNLRHWLFHWRVVSLALENGAEIDMAKTGVRAVTPDLRKPCPIPDHSDLKTIAVLEEHHASMLRIIIKKIKDNPEISKLEDEEFANALQHMMGEQDTSLLESLVEVGKRQRKELHHNAHLLPYLIYQEVFKADPSNDEEAPSENKKETPLLPMPGSSGTFLRDFFRIQLKRFIRSNASQKNPVAVQQSEANPTEQSEEGLSVVQQPEKKPLEKLVWAVHSDRAQALEAYIADRCRQLNVDRKDIPPEQYLEFKELVQDEQGIYFFKEILKFMHHVSEVFVSDALDSHAAKTPDALKQQLIDILGEAQLLHFLTHYSRKHYDPKLGRNVIDINDFLFLSLASDNLAAICQALCNPDSTQGEERNPYTAPDIEAQKKAEQAVRAYIDYKSKLAEQSVNIEKMKIRYAYALRNLQRRFSLIQAYTIMNTYNRGFSISPLQKLAIPEDKLKSLYVHLEDKEEG